MAHTLCTYKTFEGEGVLPNTIMATLRGGGGIKVLKMYYVVCDWSLRLVLMIFFWKLAIIYSILKLCINFGTNDL